MFEGSATMRAESARQLIPQWDAPLVAASIAISLLGAFTSTQLVCQARASRYFAGALLWTALGSLTFGFCSIWSLHEVAMLAYELDLRIGIDVGLTTLSAVLAVCFTFFALASDLLWDRFSKRGRERRSRSKRRTRSAGADAPRRPRSSAAADEDSSEPLLHQFRQVNGFERSSNSRNPFMTDARHRMHEANHLHLDSPLTESPAAIDPPQPSSIQEPVVQPSDSFNAAGSEMDSEGDLETGSYGDTLSFTDNDRQSSSMGDSASGLGLGGILSLKRYTSHPKMSSNPFIAVYTTLYTGLNTRSVVKGFFWAIAITSMHYVGIRALRVPRGHVILSPALVALSGLICWVVCVVGCVLLPEIETNLGQQLLFSTVATCGVAAMHFTGMRAATFYSFDQPSTDKGYPPGLATAIATVAISTCIAANLLLAHSATVSRNKLAEIVSTRRKLWMAVAQKEVAESAAAARSDFIASASHEIRTPLHHLQGYSDLLSRTELTEEGRMLLYSIQRATKTLSLITNNVLDWSRLEKDGGEANVRPVSLDLRTTCESIVTLLPQDDDADVELMVVVAPDVPHSLFIDETFIHRILMNLLSNALKFTNSGFVLLLIEMQADNMVATVTDTGCGVPSSFLPQLFEPFKQAQIRGRARGTGLGLSIIKQLLQKMGGRIDVDSTYQGDGDGGPESSGSTFTVTIPVQHSPSPRPALNLNDPTIAVFHGGTDRALPGLCLAWKKFGFDARVAKDPSDISRIDPKYIWADITSMMKDPKLLPELTKRTQSVVLIPYETESTLFDVPGLAQAPQHIIPIQKPLIWHAIDKKIATAALQRGKSNLPRLVRFDSVITDMDEDQGKETASKTVYGQPTFANSFAEDEAIVEVVVKEPSPRKDLVVLLVEDNPINCKLGKKMLHSLGYKVLVAEDGVIAVEQIIEHDATVDMILMDQSMPRKDGLTATKEIRSLEKEGTLSRTHPIIAVSAVVSTEAQTLFRLAGADDFLAKPLSLGRLEEALEAHLHPGQGSV